jgi:hypothetical protein
MHVQIILPPDVISLYLSDLSRLDADEVIITSGVRVYRDATDQLAQTRLVEVIDIRIDHDEPNWARARRMQESGHVKIIEAVEDEFTTLVCALRTLCPENTLSWTIDGIRQPEEKI